MQVAYWQLAIVASITFAFWLSRRSALRARMRISVLPWGLGALWIAWTVNRILFSQDLLNLQLFVVSAAMIGNIYYAWALRKTERAVRATRHAQAESIALREKLEALSADLDLSERERSALHAAAARPGSTHQLLETKADHQRALYSAINEARKTLCITSGWINERAVGNELIEALRVALERGVLVAVAFGFEFRNKPAELGEDTLRAVERLEQLGRETAVNDKPRLFIAYVRVHAKVVVQDAEVTAVSSNNWLSNTSFYNAELGAVINDPTFAEQMRRRVMDLVKDASPDGVSQSLRREANGRGTARPQGN